MTLEGRRNALLALHFHEGEAGDAAAHVADCVECRQYLAAVADVEGAFRKTADDAPPAGLRAQVLARAASAAQVGAPRRRPAAPSAAPLLGLLPAMVMMLALVWLTGGYLASWSFWDALAPRLQALAPFVAAALVVGVAGGLGSLALAPALVLERQKT